jgi:hypothetical protein
MSPSMNKGMGYVTVENSALESDILSEYVKWCSCQSGKITFYKK